MRQHFPDLHTFFGNVRSVVPGPLGEIEGIEVVEPSAALTETDAGGQQARTATGNPLSTIESLQWLRFIAASLVVIYHVEVQLSRLDGIPRYDLGIGASGVDIFFVISGFIMVYITHGRRDGFLSFMRRRILRILPIYWLGTLFVLTLLFVAPALLHSTTFDMAHVV